MSYLILKDYNLSIQDVNTQQIITNNESIRVSAELVAEAEAKSHLKQKYDISTEFRDTNKWDKTLAYNAADRVYLDATVYNPLTTYVVGNFTIFNGNFYRCITNTTGVFDASKWLLIGAQYDIYYANYPYPLFNYISFYNVNDLVFWNNKIYRCKVQTPIVDHDLSLQYYLIENIPLPNIAPDDPIMGAQYWFLVGSYDVPANTDITNTTYWIAGDNRDPQLVKYVVDIALYHMHLRIAPRNIPEIRVLAYKGRTEEVVIGSNGPQYPLLSAIGWLQGCAREDVTPQLPLIQPHQGYRIRFGGRVREINSY